MTTTELIRDRMAALDLAKPGGQEQLRKLLEVRGVVVTAQAISTWVRGDRLPDLGKYLILLDLFDVYDGDRLAALEQLARDVAANSAANVSSSVSG